MSDRRADAIIDATLGEALTNLKEAEKLIDRLLDWAMANRNTKSEFVTCYTYGGRNVPQVIADAKQFLGESIDHLAILPDRLGRGSAE